MQITLAPVKIPAFEIPETRPAIPAETFAARCDTLFQRADCDWVVVYADREHQANIAFLTGFEPRFEEALLLLGRAGERIIVTGNESSSYTAIAGLEGVETVLSQSMSLMGQDRSRKPNLEQVLSDCGIKAGQSIGLVGWKYLEPGESEDAGYFLPHHFVRVLQRLAGDKGALSDVTGLLMHETDGLRAVVDADEIAMLEWGAARASVAVWRILSQARPGESELTAAARMGYAGEPMSCHFMLSAQNASADVIGLSSPSSRTLRLGDGITTAVGYWGGLSSRAGLLGDGDDAFLAKAAGYFEALVTWYETADIGTEGGTLYKAAEDALARHGLDTALNPGHLLSHDEWMNTPIRKGGNGLIASGMPVQVDVIPVPMNKGQALNCEDAVVFADDSLREDIRLKHPQMFARMMARRDFVRDALGIDLKPCVLPLSNTPLCLAPFWLKHDHLLVHGR
ncbi:Xaa-Pro aminopeptidase [uncultured Martelella sp.]|uniref:Xaa-Pro aminopeptidase n=1 Tax=uncultured Martelella sp. TaxID=392331 RepID=UPI0029C72104|nr:Xaa-Pro aminopeptidase [uncultured Martelella sp.]